MIDFSPINIRTWSILGQRGTLGVALTEMANDDPDLIVLTADLGRTSGLARFMEKKPDQFFNMGIAEQNMVTMAAGLAKEGKHVFATSFANFLAMRSYEQIRLCLGYMNLPVKAVGIGSGYAMGFFGNSHYGIEDLSLMRMIPGLIVLSPADCMEVVKCLQAVKDLPRSVYIRLTGTMNQAMVYRKDYDFTIGKAVHLDDSKGKDISIFATGTMVAESQKAAKMIRESGLDTHVMNIHTISPLDRDAVIEACRCSRLLVSVEEHSTVGGLGGAISEVMSGIERTPHLLRIGMPNTFVHPGDYHYLLEKYGLTARSIANSILQEIGQTPANASV